MSCYHNKFTEKRLTTCKKLTLMALLLRRHGEITHVMFYSLLQNLP